MELTTKEGGEGMVDDEDEEEGEGGDRHNTYTCDEAIDAIGFGRFQWLLTSLSGIFIAGEAMEIMLVALVLPIIKDEWRLRPWESGLLGGAVFLGAFVGAYAWGRIADVYGRRKAFQSVALFVGIFGMLSAVPLGKGLPDYAMLVATRGMVGFGVGGFHVSFSFVVEFLPEKSRGPFLASMNYFFAIGAVFEAGLVWFFLSVVGSWRWLLFASSLPIWIAYFSSDLLPESPRFLLVSNRVDDAKQVLSRIAEENNKQMPAGRLQSCHAEERGNLLQLFSAALWKTTILLWLVWLVNTVSYYGLVILTGEYFKGSYEFVAILITTCSEFPGVTGAVVTANCCGRKRVMSLSLLTACAFELLLLVQWPLALQAFLIFMGRTMLIVSVSVAYTYTPEVYPTSLRGVGMGAAFGMARIAGMLAPFIVEVLNEVHRAIPLLIFSSCALLAAVFASLLPVETRDKRLQDRLW